MDLVELFKIAAQNKASDLHLVVGVPPVLRIDGDLSYIEGAKPVTDKEMEQMAYSVLDEKQKERFISARELDFGYEVESFRYRVNYHFERNNIFLISISVTGRIIDWSLITTILGITIYTSLPCLSHIFWTRILKIITITLLR